MTRLSPGSLISTELYASIVLAVLLSTIIPPFCLRFTISHYNKKAEKAIAAAAQAELERLEGTTKSEADLVEAIKKHSTFFLCIQTQSESSWGLMHKIMNAMQKLGLDIIDHRSWHPRGINTTLVNEIYCKGNIDPDVLMNGDESDVMETKIAEVKTKLLEAIDQPVRLSLCPRRLFAPGGIFSRRALLCESLGCCPSSCPAVVSRRG